GNEDEWEEDFEDDLVYFLSNLEQLMARLIEMNTEHHSSVTFRFIVEMINHAATFSDGLVRTKVNTDSLQEALNNLAPIYPALRSLQVRGNRLLLETLVGVSNENVDWPAESRSSVNQICQGGILILEHYFSFFETLFDSIDAQERWKEVCNTFIAELKQIVAEDDFGEVLKQ